jgi:histidinol dehydrogenase
LTTADTAGVSWRNKGEIVVVDSLEEAADFANEWAPEHLEIHTKYPHWLLEKLVNYGSCFIGVEAAEVFADKVSGTNHTLPTARAARYTGGVWVGMFLKWITHQWIDEKAMRTLADITVRQSTVEGMIAHAESAAIRLRKFEAGEMKSR